MEQEQAPISETSETVRGETWTEFAKRIGAEIRLGRRAPDTEGLGLVTSFITEEELVEANRIFEIGGPPRPRRTPRLFRRFGRVASN